MQRISVLFVTLLSATFGSGACPDGWTKYGTSCFALMSNNEPWGNANIFCHEMGGALAALNSTTKANHVKEFLEYIQAQDNIWVGGTDSAREGHWVWIGNNDHFHHAEWNKGEPNSHGGDEDCLMVLASQNHKWADALCNNKYAYLCERPL